MQEEIFGAYRILEKIGEGAMGSVHAAFHEGLRRKVALKRMALTAEPEIVARFLREMKLAAQLRHPHLVALLDAGFVAEVPYIAMELLEGGTLQPTDPAIRNLPWRAKATLLSHVADGLASFVRPGAASRPGP